MFPARRQFNIAADHFDFPGAVAELYDTYPQLRDKTFFVNVGDFTLVHPGIHTLGYNIRSRQKLVDTNEKFKKLRNSCCYTYDDKRFVFLYAENDRTSILGGRASSLHQNHFTLDHEAAHAVIPSAHYNGVDTINFAETVADAFAVIRHYQKFGLQSTALDDLPRQRALYAFFRPETNAPLGHFTANVVEKIIQMREGLNIPNLSPDETIKLALHFAQTFRIAPGVLQEWNQTTFEKTITKFRQPDDDSARSDEGLRLLADAVLNTTSPLIAKWGYRVLDGLLNGEITKVPRKGMPEFIIPALEGFHWKDVAIQLRQRKENYQTMITQSAVFTSYKK